MKTVKIMSGLPGSGKTWFAKRLKPDVICSADDYHMVDGVYTFNPARVEGAHATCLRCFATMVMTDGPQLIVVDNTNTTPEEIAPYFRLARAFGHDVEIIRIWCELEVAIYRNVHSVPLPTILHMYTNMLTKPVPAQWKMSVIPRELK